MSDGLHITQSLRSGEQDSALVTQDTPSDSATEACPAGPFRPSQRYQIIDELARGGMGVIYLARDTQLGRDVALKVLLNLPKSPQLIAKRFHTESRITAQLQHPAIPPVHDQGILEDGRPFLAMKLIKGQTLDQLLKARVQPQDDRERFIAAFEQVCQALAYAHAHDVIHRDLKPANVMIGAFGEVQVMDWGLAKVLSESDNFSDPESTSSGTVISTVDDSDGPGQATVAGTVLGTPAYMPPEQALGAIGQVDTRSDVFGLGALLAVILSGQPPFVGKTAETTRILAAQGKVSDCFDRLDQCQAEAELVALCKKCLSTNPTDRPTHAGEVAQAIAQFRSEANARARRAEVSLAETAVRQSEQNRRRRMLRVSALVALTILTVGCIGTTLGFLNARAARDDEAVARKAAEEATDLVKKSLASEKQARQQADESAALAQESLIVVGSKLPELFRKSEYARGAQKQLAALLEQALEKQANANTTRSARAKARYELELRRGDLAVLAAEYQQGVKHYTNALALVKDIDVSDARSAFREAEVYRKIGSAQSLIPVNAFGLPNPAKSFAQAEESLEAAAKLHQAIPGLERQAALERARLYYSRAEYLRRAQHFPKAVEQNVEAITLFEQLLGQYPDDVELKFELADVHILHGDLGRLLEDDFLTEGSLHRSAKLLNELLPLDQYDLSVLTRLAAVSKDLGRFYVRTERNEIAKRHFNRSILCHERMVRLPEIIAIKTDMTYALYQMYSLYKSLQDPRAERYIDQVIEYRREHTLAQPLNTHAKFALGRALTEKGYSIEATQLVASVLQSHPNEALTLTDSANILGKNAEKLLNGRSLNQLTPGEFQTYAILRGVALFNLKKLLVWYDYRDVNTFKALAAPLKDTKVYEETLKKVEANAAKGVKK